MHDQILVSLDLETTGLDPEKDAIIEIGAVKFQGDRDIGIFHTLVNPHRRLSYRIRMLTGITQEELDAAPDFSVVADSLASFIGNHHIVGQNVSFDLDFLGRRGLTFTNTVYDILDVASVLLPCLQDYTLSTLARELEIPCPVQHRALADAVTVKGVLLALLDRASGLDLPIVAEINRLAASSGWSWRSFFLDLERGRAAKMLLWDRQDWEARFLPQLPELPDRKMPAERSATKPLDLKWLSTFLSEGGAMAEAFPGFEYRPGQVSMMHRVARAFNQNDRVIVEAGTGIGKSVAYLLPAVIFALENNTPVVISTNTINLQEQLMNKDIPDLVQVLANSRKYSPVSGLQSAQLKGRTNYLCLRRWTAWRQSAGIPCEEAQFLLRLLLWTISTTSGDRSELNLNRNEMNLWRKVCASQEHCVAARCPYYPNACFLYRARRVAQGAHLLVINHALLLSDLVKNGGILPEYRCLVIDEAHHLEEEATEQMGYRVSGGDIHDQLGQIGDRGGFGPRLRGYLRDAPLISSRRQWLMEKLKGIQAKAKSGEAHAAELVGAISSFMQASRQGGHTEYGGNLRITGAIRGHPKWSEAELSCENLSLDLENIERGLKDLCTAMDNMPDRDRRTPELVGVLAEMSSLQQQVRTLQDQLRSIICSPDGKTIYWAELDSQGMLSLHAAPLHVGEILQRTLFAEKDTVVLTSATLSIGGSFDYIKDALGLSETDDLVVDSPFDYKKSTMVYLPEDIPEPETAGYQQAVSLTITTLCRATKGRTLVLFTSHTALRNTYSAVQESLGEDGILVLGQGIDGSPRRLLNHLKANPNTVVFGTAAMWEGVDVVGKALSVLVITRLPFIVPTDPVFAARAELFDDPFNEYMVPQAVLRFKQGFGRLIRSRSDRGVAVILDRRIQTKSYGRVFMDSLPKCTVKKGPLRQIPQEVVKWLGD